MQEHQTELKRCSAQRDQRLAESVELLASVEDDGDKTVNSQPQKITRKPITLAAGTPMSHEKDMSSFFAPHSSLKKTPVYSEPPNKKTIYLMISCPLTSKFLVPRILGGLEID